MASKGLKKGFKGLQGSLKVCVLLPFLNLKSRGLP